MQFSPLMQSFNAEKNTVKNSKTEAETQNTHHWTKHLLCGGRDHIIEEQDWFCGYSMGM